ncbi:MAG: hydroxymethylglutaryl-CoA lyase [Firmicutes bacterium]|nr:hydroxymethylglutaryl-CoA lyase [Bacillota bacterium]
MEWPMQVTVWEVGPRDGLQNEAAFLATEDKIAWIHMLADAGVSHLEVSSFVSPRWIPQLADADEVCAHLPRDRGIVYAALVPNLQGLERARQAALDVAAIFLSASETHSQRNINKGVAPALAQYRALTETAVAGGMRVRAYISTVFGCPYEGEVDVDTVRRIALTLLEAGVYEVSLGDTIGVATPRSTEAVLSSLLRDIRPAQLALHMHDTRGAALANLVVGLQHGIAVMDSSLGGLGGCPYAPGAAGNVATDDLVRMLHGCSVVTGIDEGLLAKAGAFVAERLHTTLASKMSRVYAGGAGS